MAYEICNRCSKMFKKNGKLYCEDCIGKVEKEHDLIIDYVRKHPNSTVLDIITQTGVTLKSINSLIENGYVSYKEEKIKPLDSDELSQISDKKGQFHIRKDK